MRELWDAIQTIESWDEFVQWFEIQSNGMQIFVSMAGVGLVIAVTLLILFTFNMED